MKGIPHLLSQASHGRLTRAAFYVAPFVKPSVVIECLTMSGRWGDRR
jgi:hypothetical protein